MQAPIWSKRPRVVTSSSLQTSSQQTCKLSLESLYHCNILHGLFQCCTYSIACKPASCLSKQKLLEVDLKSAAPVANNNYVKSNQHACQKAYTALIPATSVHISKPINLLHLPHTTSRSGLPPEEASVMIAEKRKLLFSFLSHNKSKAG